VGSFLWEETTLSRGARIDIINISPTYTKVIRQTTENERARIFTGPYRQIQFSLSKEIHKNDGWFYYATEVDTILVRSDPDCSSINILRPGVAPGARLRRQLRHELIVDICVAFAPLRLPPYVLLEIIDYLPRMEHATRLKKITIIEGVHHAVKRRYEARGENK
jgi:hypothetical protein